MRPKGSGLEGSSTKLNAKSSSSPSKTGVAEKRERNAMHHSSPSSDSSDFLKQRSGVELLLLLFLSSPSLSLSLSLSLSQWILAAERKRARPSSPVSSRSRRFIPAAVFLSPRWSTKRFFSVL